jgi:hypothetical protein
MAIKCWIVAATVIFGLVALVGGYVTQNAVLRPRLVTGAPIEVNSLRSLVLTNADAAERLSSSSVKSSDEER